MTTELITSLGYEAVLTARNAIAEKIEQAHALLREAQKVADEWKLGTVCGRHPHQLMPMKAFLGLDGARAAIRLTDNEAWRLLWTRTHMLDLMSAGSKDAWETSIEKGEAPPFNEAAIIATVRDLYAKRSSMFELSVVECFEKLSHGYATNQEARFGKRIVITYVTSVFDMRPGNNACDQIDDLLRFMTVLDGKPIPHCHTVRSAIIAASKPGAERKLENEYFVLKWFKNGNGHLTFKRADLVEAMNQVLAKHRANSLPCPLHKNRSRRYEAPAARKPL